MAKSMPCKLLLNTRLGRISPAIEFKCISEAVRFAKASGYFAYRVFDHDGRVIRRGLCE